MFYKKAQTGAKVCREGLCSMRVDIPKDSENSNSWWHFVQLLTSEKWVTSCEWRPHKRTPGENWQQLKCKLFYIFRENARFTVRSFVEMQDSSSHACRNVTLHTNVVVRFPKIFLRQPCKSKKKNHNNKKESHHRQQFYTLEASHNIHALNFPVLPHQH